MILKLVNSFPAYKGQTVLINSDFIVNVISNTVTRDDGAIEAVTTVHCPPHGVWEVAETPDEIYALLTGGSVIKSEPMLLKEATEVAAAPKKARKKA
jgi:hypothetical protein